MNWKKIIKQSDFNKPPNDFNKPRDLSNPGSTYQRGVPPKVLKQIEELQDSPLISALEMSISNSANADLDDMFDKVEMLLDIHSK